MKKAYATIILFETELGGRKSPIISDRYYACPLFFTTPKELTSHGFDCRMLVNEVGVDIYPGQSKDNIPIIFLSPDEVFPYLKIGTIFDIWENGYIGKGIITKI
ncbi:TPA: hypothetical protein ACKRF0_000946 [Proteus mirabilis]